jgi:potassium-transporting ATPase KdpC subunit
MSRLPNWIRQHLAAIRALIVLTIITGAIYPLVVYGIAQAAFPKAANGSLVSSHGKVAGSSLLCQQFVDSKGNPLPQYFQERPSAASDPTAKSNTAEAQGCDPLFSGASNLGPDNPKLVTSVNANRKAAAELNGVSPNSVPPDAVTASGSGLDPAISPQYAYLQVNRVAQARHLDPAKVRALVTSHIQGRTLGFLGEPRVDVLQLNLALDQGQAG